MQFVPFEQARKDQKDNPAPRWHKPASPADINTASSRYSQEFFPPALAAPKFQIRPDENFFMIGSCFARGLESALANRKFAILSKSSVFDRWTITAGGSALGATNKYNLASIRNEMAWAFGEESFADNALVQLSDDLFYDPHMTPVFAPAPLDEVRAKRQAMTDLVRQARNADVVVVTLGLVEVWKDTQVELVTNSTPNPLALRKMPERFQFGRLDYSANLALLEETYQLLSRHAKPGFRMLVTVSPVPLEATFTGRDVVEATTYSKSLLRVVAEDFALSKPNVEYFPSYEIVMNSPRANAWMEDNRHVQGKLANFIMSKFVAHYLPDLHIQKGEQLVASEYVA